jgi:hypothetical protein
MHPLAGSMAAPHDVRTAAEPHHQEKQGGQEKKIEKGVHVGTFLAALNPNGSLRGRAATMPASLGEIFASHQK